MGNKLLKFITEVDDGTNIVTEFGFDADVTWSYEYVKGLVADMVKRAKAQGLILNSRIIFNEADNSVQIELIKKETGGF